MIGPTDLLHPYWGIKSKIIRWLGACGMQGEVKKCLLVFRRGTSEKDDMQDLGVDGRILFFISRNWIELIFFRLRASDRTLRMR